MNLEIRHFLKKKDEKGRNKKVVGSMQNESCDEHYSKVLLPFTATRTTVSAVTSMTWRHGHYHKHSIEHTYSTTSITTNILW